MANERSPQCPETDIERDRTPEWEGSDVWFRHAIAVLDLVARFRRPWGALDPRRGILDFGDSVDTQCVQIEYSNCLRFVYHELLPFDIARNYAHPKYLPGLRLNTGDGRHHTLIVQRP